MNRKINRVLGEIQKTEKKIAEWQEYLKELNIRRKQMEDAEIIKSVRSMKLDSCELLEVLESIQNGMMDFRYSVSEYAGKGQSENITEIKEDDNSESED